MVATLVIATFIAAMLFVAYVATIPFEPRRTQVARFTADRLERRRAERHERRLRRDVRRHRIAMYRAELAEQLRCQRISHRRLLRDHLAIVCLRFRLWQVGR